MMGNGDSGKGGGGLFASIGRLFGRRAPDDGEAASDRSDADQFTAKKPEDEAGDRLELPPEPGAAEPAISPGGADSEDELVLGPALKVPASGEEGSPEDDSSEDELTLTGASPGGDAGEDASEDTPVATDAGSGDEEEIVARLRALRGEPGEDEAAEDDRLTTPEDEWAASFGAAVPESAREESEKEESGAGDSDTGLPDAGQEARPWPSWPEPEEAEATAAEPSPWEPTEPGGTLDADAAEPEETALAAEDEESQDTVPLFPGIATGAGADAGDDSEAEESDSAVKSDADSAPESTGEAPDTVQPDAEKPEDAEPDAEESKTAAALETGTEAEPAAAGTIGPEDIDAGESEDGAMGARDEEEDDIDAGKVEAASGDADESEAEAEEAELVRALARPAEQTDDRDGADVETPKADEAGDDEAGLADADESEPGTEGFEHEESTGEEAAADEEKAGLAGATGPEAPEPDPARPDSPETAEGAAEEIVPLLGPAATLPGDAGETAEPAEAATPALDEAAVEEIVRRLIREEMEGELGERLSANIRRMIRDEVGRAMMRHR